MPTRTKPDAHALLPKDYISTVEGLYFAVVLHVVPDKPVYCSLRYITLPDGSRHKLDTAQAFDFLGKYHPDFLSYSDYLDAETILLPLETIRSIFRAVDTPGQIQHSCNDDRLKHTALQVFNFMVENNIPRQSIGITGSLMLDFHSQDSDIDIVIYDPSDFSHARKVIKDSIKDGHMEPLNESAWLETYRRRACAIDFEDYKKHEVRKYNKFLMNGTKVDISYVPVQNDNQYTTSITKIGHATIRAKIIDDSRIFSYPACYITNHEEIREIHCYTATYTGQAFNGESIEATGMIEQDANGQQYMVIGTSREAINEYLKVIDEQLPN